MWPLCAPLSSLFDADTKYWRKYIDYNIHPSLSGVCILYPYWTITQPFVHIFVQQTLLGIISKRDSELLYAFALSSAVPSFATSPWYML